MTEPAGDSWLLAGGQTLIPQLARRAIRPSLLVDLGGLGELRYIRLNAAHLVVGAMTRQRDVECSVIARSACPLLVRAVNNMGNRQVRNVGTIGGVLAYADPRAQLPVVALALDAHMSLLSAAGSRDVDADVFFGGTAPRRRRDEILTEVRFPVFARSRGSFLQFASRPGDVPDVAVALVVVFDDAERTIAEARIAMTLGAGPSRVRQLEGRLTGLERATAVRAARGDRDLLGETAVGDAYRRNVAAILIQRCLAEAVT